MIDRRKKGAFEHIVAIVFGVFCMLLILFAAIVIGNVSVATDLEANRLSNTLQFQSHTAISAINSNRTLMKKAGVYNLSGSEAGEEEINETFERALSPFKRYEAELMSRTEEGYVTMTNTSSSEDGRMAFSSMLIASPSENQRKIRIGVFGW